MRCVTYSMSVSLDGYVVGPDGDFDWTAPDEQVFRFWIDEIRGVGVHLLGRRLYETMLYWETADQDRSEEHTSELQSRSDLVCRLLLEKKKRPQAPSGQPKPWFSWKICSLTGRAQASAGSRQLPSLTYARRQFTSLARRRSLA